MGQTEPLQRSAPARDAHRSASRARFEVPACVALLFMLPLLRLGGVPDFPVLLGFLAFGLPFGALAVWRWDLPLPFDAPWYRIVAVAVALIGVSILLPTSSDSVTPGGVTPGPGTAIILAVLLVPAAVGYELFSRGALYSLIDARWGAGAAVLGSTIPDVIVLLPRSGALTAASALVLALFFGLSRATTGSLAPAILARLLMAGGGSFFLLFVH